MALRDLRIYRLLSPDLIDLYAEIESRFDEETDEEIPYPPELASEKVIRDCSKLLAKSDNVRNVKRLYADLLFRETENPTALGSGIAIPHVRTNNVKDLTMCFLRYLKGVNMKSLDGKPVYLVFAIVTPREENSSDYQKVYRKIIKWIQVPQFRDELMTACNCSEITKALRMAE